MGAWLLTIHKPDGTRSSVTMGEMQFVIGTETASDVYTIEGEGVAPRHAWVWIAEGHMQVEPLGSGTLVNGYTIQERVQVKYPASVQVGSVTLMVEVQAARAAECAPLAETIPVSRVQRSNPTSSVHDIAITIPTNTAKAGGSHAPVEDSSLAETIPATKSAVTMRDRQLAVTPDFNQAEVVCKYELVREIARGGMGQIYFGEDPQLKRQVAVKVSSVACGGEDPRFTKEAEVLAHLAHPNIVPIYNIGVDAQMRPFYSMKLVKGRTLQALINQIRDGDAAVVKDYPRSTLLTIFRKVCDAMAFAHSKGILHRDLKPENIMVGEYGEVLVMDWGLAKVLGERDAEGSSKTHSSDTSDYGMTMEGEVMGTPQYMSPEQAEGMVAELDARSDIYSLGGILYAILTLRAPIDGTTLNEVLSKVKNGQITAMVTKRRSKGDVLRGVPVAMGMDVPEALQAVTLKAMATDRGRRYAGVEEFARDIEAYQNGFATSAEDAGAWKQVVLFINRHKGVSAAVGLFLIAAVAFTVKLAASERIARANEKQALVEQEKSRRSEADAQMVLAESEYSAGNADKMRLALLKVPEDLRSQVWRYLDERSVGGDASALPESGSSWMGLAPNPLQRGRFFAIRSDGACCDIEGETGTVKVIWKTDAVITFAGQFSVARDGSVMAFVARTKNQKDREQIQIRRVTDGTLLRGFALPRDRRLSGRLWISANHLVAQMEQEHVSQQKGFFLTAWSLAENRVVWELPQQARNSFVSFSSDSTEICFLNPAGFLQRIEASSGKILLQAKGSIGRVSAFNPEAYDGSSDLNQLAISSGRPEGVRVFSDAWNAKLQTEFVSSFRITALAFLPETDLLLTQCVVSEQAGCLEVRDLKQGGMLVRSLPFSNPKVRWDYMNSLRCSGAFAALVLPNRIRIWNFNQTTPCQSSTRVSGNSYSVLSPNGTQVLGIRKGGNPPRIEDIRFFDVSGGWEFPKETGKVLLPPLRPGGPPVLRGGMEDRSLMVESDRNGRRWLLKSFGDALGFAVESGELKNLWGEPKRLLSRYNSWMQRMLVHPEADLLWTGDSVVEFSTGRELRQINRGQLKYYGTGRQSRVSWLGATHVVEECPLLPEGEEDSERYESNRIVLWNTESGEPVANELSPHGVCLSVSADGSKLAEGGSDTRVRFRNVKTLAVESEFRAHDASVKSIDFHPVLPILATMSGTEVRLWDLKDGRMLEEIRLDFRGETIRFVADGRQMQVNGTLFKPKSCGP